MATIICQRCGEKTSTAVCSNCGYLNSSSKIDSYNSTSSSKDSPGGKSITAELCFKAWKKRTASGRFYSFINIFSTMLGALYLLLCTLSCIAALILYIFKVIDVVPMVAAITCVVCYALLILSIPLVILTEIIRTVGIRSFCINNNLRVFSDTNEKQDVPVLDAYATSQSSGRLVAYLILHTFEVGYFLCCRSLLITLPLIFSFFISFLPELNVVSIIIIPVAPLLVVAIALLIPTIFNAIISKIKNSIIYKS